MNSCDKNTSKELWEVYPVTGLVFAILLVMIDCPHPAVYQIIPVAVFVFVTGVKGNLQTLLDMIKRQWYMVAAFAAFCAFFFATGRISMGLVFASGFSICYAGKCVAENCKDIRGVIIRMLIILAVVMAFTLIRALKAHDVQSFLRGILREAAVFAMWSAAGMVLGRIGTLNNKSGDAGHNKAGKKETV